MSTSSTTSGGNNGGGNGGGNGGQNFIQATHVARDMLGDIKKMEKEHRNVLTQRIELLQKLQELEKKEIELTEELNSKKAKFKQMLEDKQNKDKKRTHLSRNFSIIFEDPQQVKKDMEDEKKQREVIVKTKELKRVKTKPRLLGSIDPEEPSSMYSPRIAKLNPKLYEVMQTLLIEPFKSREPLKFMEGPITDEAKNHSSIEHPPELSYKNVFSGRTISTYPISASKQTREGDPICDRFCFELYPSSAICVIADGCNWGTRPREAALKATLAFVKYLSDNQDKLVDLKECGHILLRAITASHNAIIEGKEDVWEAGTTTLLGGVLIELKPQKTSNELLDSRWAFVCVSVGDCKAYHWDSKTKVVIDITEGNRQNLADATDPGGRLGPYLNGGTPDLRNLELYFQTCNEGDLILMMSDGLHDNLDPQSFGKSPTEFGIEAETWAQAEQNFGEQAEDAKNTFRRKIIEKEMQILEQENNFSPSSISARLVDYCDQLTKPSRDFMVNNPGKKLPNDYSLYPGKMDHTTCCVLRIEPYQ